MKKKQDILHSRAASVGVGVQGCEWASVQGRRGPVCEGVHVRACVYCCCVEGGVARWSLLEMKKKKKKTRKKNRHTAFEGSERWRGHARACDGMSGRCVRAGMGRACDLCEGVCTSAFEGSGAWAWACVHACVCCHCMREGGRQT